MNAQKRILERTRSIKIAKKNKKKKKTTIIQWWHEMKGALPTLH